MKLVALVVLCACGSRLKVDPVRIEPIHMTIDVNVHDDDEAAQNRRDKPVR